MMFRVAGHFASITDTREINPWGIPGFILTIARDGVEEWQNFLKENQGDNPLARNIARESVRLAMSNRRAKKNMRMSDDELMDAAVTRATEKMEPVGQVDVDKMKDGVAEILIRGWRGVEVARKACTSCKHEWAPDKSGEPCPECGDAVSMDVGQAVEPTIENKRKLLENTVDENGNKRWVPKIDEQGRTMQAGNQPFGDALMQLIIEEAGVAEEFYAKFMEDAAGN